MGIDSLGRGGSVALRYLGHSAFLWTTGMGVRILVDPYRNSCAARWFSEPFPRLASDIVLITHPHYDHDAVDRVEGEPTMLREPVTFSVKDVRIHGVQGRHAGDYGEGFAHDNVVFIVETAGLRFCHLGDNRADVAGTMRDAPGSIDVLMVPVDDSCHLLTYEEVDRVVACVNPRIIIPMHYRIPGLTSRTCPLGGIEGWLRTQPRVRHVAGGHRLSPAHLPGTPEVWVFAIDTSAISHPDQ